MSESQRNNKATVTLGCHGYLSSNATEKEISEMKKLLRQTIKEIAPALDKRKISIRRCNGLTEILLICRADVDEEIYYERKPAAD